MPSTASRQQPRWAASRASRLLTAAACAVTMGIVGFVNTFGGDRGNGADPARVYLRQLVRWLTTSARQPSMLGIPVAMLSPMS